MTSRARFAALAAEPTRAAMLHALMDGRALTASELARVAGVTPQTASDHLGKLVAGGLLCVQQQGRHRYHRLASAAVAPMLESIVQVASSTPMRRLLATGPKDEALRRARTCYDHLAGRLGVALADALVAGGHIDLTHDAGVLNGSGLSLLVRIGLDIDVPSISPGMSKRGRVLCRPCLDWSERRPHLAGALGAALCSLSFEKGWIRRIDGTRAVRITPAGYRDYHDLLGVRLMPRA
jgi:DNA-binding transcriptional ArsR family regulator